MRISLRRALIASALLSGLAFLIVLAVGFARIRDSIESEALERAQRDLDTATSITLRELEIQSLRLADAVEQACDSDPAALDGATLLDLRRRLDFTVLNLCDPEGRPLAGSYPDASARVPVGQDPVLRRALLGRPERGFLHLEPRRLDAEGGAALRAFAVDPREGPATPAETGALFRWIAHPLFDADGRLTGLLYGGSPLNYDFTHVDTLRDMIFGTALHEQKPLGTVTVFQGPLRVATNVLDPAGERAVGTRVSEAVRRAVLEDGRHWRDRAWVVDRWYLSSYRPLRDPDGRVLGMLYVGLLEAPYRELLRAQLLRFLLPAGLVFLAGVALAWLVVKRMALPLHRLRRSAERLHDGRWIAGPDIHSEFEEIHALSAAFQRMQAAISDRDAALRRQNATLEEVNGNYMRMLGFVTHELRAPLAANQGFLELMLEGQLGTVPETMAPFLLRIQRNSQDLQDMVKNYLDLSRAERGELEARPVDLELVGEVLEPAIAQAEPLLKTRGMKLERELPSSLPLRGDPEQLRIAVGNYLSNAAKYGREGGRVKLTAIADEARVELGVWNEGNGFTPEEGERLFARFSRLRNATTREQRGSGLGLYLVRRIAEQHGGEAGAESEPGAWARFDLRLPRRGIEN